LYKFILIIALCLIAVSLGAQSGLFGLRFNESYTEAEKSLLDNGLVRKAQDRYTVDFEPKTKDKIVGLTVYRHPESNKLIGWLIAYPPTRDPAATHPVVKELISLHGVEFDFRKSANIYSWSVDEGKVVMSYPHTRAGVYCVLYMDPAYEALF